MPTETAGKLIETAGKLKRTDSKLISCVKRVHKNMDILFGMCSAKEMLYEVCMCTIEIFIWGGGGGGQGGGWGEE